MKMLNVSVQLIGCIIDMQNLGLNELRILCVPKTGLLSSASGYDMKKSVFTIFWQLLLNQ